MKQPRRRPYAIEGHEKADAPLAIADRRTLAKRVRAMVYAERRARGRGKQTVNAVLEALLFRFTGPDGRCFPACQTIATAADVSLSSVHRALDWLESHGLMTWVHRIRHGSIDLVLPSPATRPGYRPSSPATVTVRRAFRSSNLYLFRNVASRLVAMALGGLPWRQASLPDTG